MKQKKTTPYFFISFTKNDNIKTIPRRAGRERGPAERHQTLRCVPEQRERQGQHPGNPGQVGDGFAFQS